MTSVQRSKVILNQLNKIYPKIKVPLKSRNNFTLLLSVLLSAQCTDVNVNNVTKDIYPKYYKPIHFVKLGRKKIEKMIRRIGIFRVKAKSIYNLSKTLLLKFNGKLRPNQKDIANNILKKTNERLAGKVVTKISLLKNYCPAEEYHQKYLEKR